MDQKRRRKKLRERRCLVTGETYSAHKMIRFVLDPAGNVIPDVAGKLPGRGGWVLADRAVLQSAMKKKIFVRFGHRASASRLALSGRGQADVETLEEPEDKPKPKAAGQKIQVRVDDNLPDLVEQLLRQRCLNYLGLVNRAGLLVSGFEKVRAKLKAHKCRALVTAEDAADNGRSKLCSGLGNVLEKIRVIDMFTRKQLGQTLGLPNAVHVVLLPGGMTESFIKEFSRYEGVAML
ncbi:COG2740: Predicted nucleic-acid-binding protein implicated in transcription termination / ribosomal protein L7Ae family protein [hydrothermal vent metagenome]|uniref:COG2740: Predicted nucleic-acid-binding protein implicated in transcription termination / ribosomal protein L7Ae family protein n=1 Tax=hydrothermal vent metagenome TaxID=652676 RepID=A0A3B1AHI3_9ZZZZ